MKTTLENKSQTERMKEDGRNARTQTEINSREQIELAKLKAGSLAYKFGEAYNLGLEIYGGDKKKAQDFVFAQTSKWKPGESKASAAQGVFNIYDTMLSYIDQDDENTAGNMLQRLTENEETKLNEFSAEFTPEENMQINGLRTAFSEYLDFHPTSSDPNEMIKQKADARDKLQAKYNAIKRGTDEGEEYTDIRRKQFDEKRRNGKENRSHDTSQANVRALLENGDKGDGNSNYVPPVAGITGYPGSYRPKVGNQ